MNFICAKDMQVRGREYNKNKITEAQKIWLSEFKENIRNKLELVYNNNPSAGTVTIYTIMQYNIINCTCTDELCNRIDTIRGDLTNLGYDVVFGFNRNKLTMAIDGCEMRINWKKCV